jgi:hypothetical protein
MTCLSWVAPDCGITNDQYVPLCDRECSRLGDVTCEVQASS